MLESPSWVAGGLSRGYTEKYARAMSFSAIHAAEVFAEDRGDPELRSQEVLSQELGFPIARRDASAVELDTEERERLARGEVVVAFEGGKPLAYAAIGEGQQLAVLGPLPGVSTAAVGRGAIVLVLVMLGLLGGATVAAWPVARQLQGLARAATHLGAGDLHARAPTQGEGLFGELATTFNVMAARLADQVDQQRALLRAVSHELRTPLARLRFGVELLDQPAASPAMRQRLEQMDRDVSALDELMGELLAYARLEQEGPPACIELVALAPLLTEATEAVALLGEAVEVEAEGPEISWNTDRRLLRRAVDNVLVNAVRHGGGWARLCWSHAREGLEITVEDRGPGVAEADRERIFEPFTRLTRSAGAGTGLGLAITRRAIERLGGSIRVEEGPRGGALFRLWLPSGADQ